MAAVQMATMTFARKLANTEYLQHQDSAERAFNGDPSDPAGAALLAGEAKTSSPHVAGDHLPARD